jgi:hypothetical protein
MSKHYGYTTIAIQSLENSGHKVTNANGDITGLWDVEDIATDVTTAQLLKLAESFGAPAFRIASPIIRNPTP